MKKIIFAVIILLILIGGITSMAYERINFVDDVTDLDAITLNVMDKGIYDNDAQITINTADIATHTSQIADVDNEIQTMNSIVQGFYATVVDLTTDFPEGNSSNYVVTADNYIYRWNVTEWASTGFLFSATGIADGSITPEKTSFMNLGKNLFNKSTVTVGYFVNDVNGALAVNASMAASDYIEVVPCASYIWSVSDIRYAWYDSTKTYISGGFSYTTVPLIAPETANYIMVTAILASIDTVQFEVRDYLTDFELYGYYLNQSAIKDKTITSGMLNDKSVSITKTDFVVTGKNIFNEALATSGYFVNNANGSLNANANYAASDYIEIEASTEYTENAVGGYYMAYYDVNKIYISGQNNGHASTYTTPATAKYMRCTIPIPYLGAFQIEKGAVSTEYQDYGYIINGGLYQIADSSTSFAPELVLPTKIYALVGQELNIYFDNIMNDRDTKYDFDVICAIGGQYENYYRTTPTEAGTYEITINAYQNGSVVATATSSIVVMAAAVGTGVTKDVLVIGDSTTANGICTQKLLDNFGVAEVMDINLLGTKGIAPDLNEGITGWKAYDFFSTAGRDGVTNPFWNAGTSAFDFAYYMTQQSYAGVDNVIINLGINDTFGYTDDAVLNTQIAAMLVQYQGMIDSIHAYDADIKIGLAVTIPPAYNQDSFGKIYGCGQTRWRYKRNNFLWAEALIEEFTGQEASEIYLVPINTNLDTRYNMGLESLSVNARNTEVTTTSIIANGNVHPDTSGYWQIADVYWYWIKSFES